MRVVSTPTASDYLMCSNLSDKHLVTLTTKRKDSVISYSAEYSNEKVSVVNLEYEFEDECESETETETERVSVTDLDSQDDWGAEVKKSGAMDIIYAKESEAEPFYVTNQNDTSSLGVQHVPASASHWALVF